MVDYMTSFLLGNGHSENIYWVECNNSENIEVIVSVNILKYVVNFS